MAKLLHISRREEEGQDLTEYSLLITFIAIACAAIIGNGRPAVNAIWTHGNADLSSADNVAAAS